MSGLTAFDKATVDGVIIDEGRMIPGSASLSVSGSDKSSATADGRTRHVRVSIIRNASFKALGDWSSLSSGTGPSVEVSLLLEGQTVASFRALASVSYDEASRSSAVSLKGDPGI